MSQSTAPTIGTHLRQLATGLEKIYHFRNMGLAYPADLRMLAARADELTGNRDAWKAYADHAAGCGIPHCDDCLELHHKASVGSHGLDKEGTT